MSRAIREKPKNSKVLEEIQLPLLGMSHLLIEEGQEWTFATEILSVISPPTAASPS